MSAQRDVLRIGVVNPNASSTATALIARDARAAAPEVALQVVGAPDGPTGIDGPLDAARAGASAVDLVASLAPSVDALVLACGNDPGLDGCRQATDQPVVGCAEAGMHLASLVAARFSIVVLSPAKATAMRRLAIAYGHRDRLASIVAMDTAPEAVFATPTAELGALVEAGRHARDHDLAEALVLPGAAMSALAPPLSTALGIPVVAGLPAAVRMAVATAHLGLRTSGAHSYRRRPGAVASPSSDGAAGSVPTAGAPA